MALNPPGSLLIVVPKDLHPSAIQREKRLQDWKRKWKVHLIEKDNPDWEDLYPMIV